MTDEEARLRRRPAPKAANAPLLAAGASAASALLVPLVCLAWPGVEGEGWLRARALPPASTSTREVTPAWLAVRIEGDVIYVDNRRTASLAGEPDGEALALAFRQRVRDRERTCGYLSHCRWEDDKVSALLVADERTPSGRVLAVTDALYGAGVDDLALVTRRP